MDVKDIPIEPSAPGVANGVKDIRQQGPVYLKAVIEQAKVVPGVTSLADLKAKDVKALSGGNRSVDYNIYSGKQWYVIKMRKRGAEAATEALRAWEKAGASVAHVEAEGIVPGQENEEQPLKYQVTKAVVNQDGELAKPVQAYLDEHPDQAHQVAVVMGKVLAKMHLAKDGKHFGEFADMKSTEVKEKPPHTWSDYLTGYIDTHVDELKRLGITQLKLNNLRQAVQELEFPDVGVYLHGDFSPRNALLRSKHPYEVVVFDPNPIIGRPSWDLAILYNNYEFARRVHDHHPDNKKEQERLKIQKDVLDGVLEGYQQAGGEPGDRKAVDAAQLMQCMYLLPGKQNKAKREGQNPEENLDAMAVKDTLFDKLEALAY